MCSRHQPDAGADSAPPMTSETEVRQSADGRAHYTYFDVRTQASFVWDGKGRFIDVCIGGYGEPVDHVIPAPQNESLTFFEGKARAHAAMLPNYGKED